MAQMQTRESRSAGPAPLARRVTAAGLAALLVCASWPATTVRAGSGSAARAFLSSHLGMSPADFRRLDQGAVVATSLDAKDRREVATRGVVHINVDADVYLERMADIVSFKRHEAVQQIGVLGTVPSVADMRDMTLDRGDIRDLRHCRVGDCNLKLPAGAIERFQREVQWGSAEAEQQANAVMRDVLVRYAAEYLRKGNAAAMRYEGDRTPVDVGAEFRSMVQSDAGLLAQFPDLARYALNYPAGRPAGVREQIYWSKEKPGPSTVVSLTHVIIMPPAPSVGGGPVRHAVMSRQIYGSRYFDASIGLTLLLPDETRGRASTYVAYVNRSRLDVFSGLLGGIIRRTVRSRVRSGMADSLGRVKAAMERTSPTAPHGSR
jgi:hypothetical protein